MLRLINKTDEFPKFVHPNVKFGRTDEGTCFLRVTLSDLTCSLGRIALLIVRDLLLSLDMKESTIVFTAEAGLEV